MSDSISRQAAIRWVKTECNPYGKPTLDFESGKKVIEHLEQMPSADRPQGEWIPCSERLPDLNENGVSDMVLLCWSDGQMTVGAYQGDRTFVGQAWPTARDCRVTVTAWQSLPKPWKGADDERRLNKEV